MRIAVIGCVHGQLKRAYAAICAQQPPPALVIMCGDIQACRSEADMESMSVPAKYRQMGDFHEYYTGKLRAPFLTLVIGGNHEASLYMSTVTDGGWIAPNIWYMGDCGVVDVDGLRVAGMSGIWYEPDFHKPRFEPELFMRDPHRACTTDARFSAYHTRDAMIERAKQIGHTVDIMVTHDWPRGIEHYGDLDKLLAAKPLFRKDVETGKLGNPATAELLDIVRPQYWLSAHLHTHFTARYRKTKFLCLDKVLPRRKFLQFIEVKPKRTNKPAFEGTVKLR